MTVPVVVGGARGLVVGGARGSERICHSSKVRAAGLMRSGWYMYGGQRTTVESVLSFHRFWGIKPRLSGLEIS